MIYLKNFIVFFLLTTSFVFSQTVVNSIPMELKKDRDVFQIIDDSKQETALFISDKYRIKDIRLNEQMLVIDSLSALRPEKKFTDMIGYNNSQGNSCLFWSSSNHKEIYAQLFDFGKKTVLNKNYSLALKDERYLQQFSTNEKFYILTILKNSNTIKLYVFDATGKLEEKTIDLSGFRFFNSEYLRTNLYGVLEEEFLPFERPYSLQKITTESPTSLKESAKKRKCYSNAKQIVLTFDTNIDYTQLITIDLVNYTAAEKYIKTPFVSFANRNEINSNSFLIDDRLFQVKLSSEKMILSVKDLNDSLINEYTATNLDVIDFKNTDLIQENGGTSNTRILEKTAQFLRKVNNSNAGISCYKAGGNYLVTLGSISEEQQNSSVMIGGMLGGFAGALIVAAISNPTYDNFNAYSNRKVVYLHSLLDEKTNHVTGEIKPLAFDVIRKFLEKNNNFSSHTVYKQDAFYYLGYYDSMTQGYVIRKFEE